MNKLHRNLIVLCIISLSVVACGVSAVTTPGATSAIEPRQTLAPAEIDCEEDMCIIGTQPVQPHPAAQSLEEVANAVIFALQARDLNVVEAYVHPELGVRFSPYAYVTEDDLVFKGEVVSRLLEDPEIYHWGLYDGSGLPIDLTFEQYFDEFVYSTDFADAAMVAYNKSIGQGNSINNLTDFYPGAEYVEYHFSGFDPQYAGMDWQSLRLVFMKVDALYYLVGIIHAEWTI